MQEAANDAAQWQLHDEREADLSEQSGHHRVRGQHLRESARSHDKTNAAGEWAFVVVFCGAVLDSTLVV